MATRLSEAGLMDGWRLKVSWHRQCSSRARAQALARASAPGGRGARLKPRRAGRPAAEPEREREPRAGPGRASNHELFALLGALGLLLYLHHAKVGLGTCVRARAWGLRATHGGHEHQAASLLLPWSVAGRR